MGVMSHCKLFFFFSLLRDRQETPRHESEQQQDSLPLVYFLFSFRYSLWGFVIPCRGFFRLRYPHADLRSAAGGLIWAFEGRRTRHLSLGEDWGGEDT